MRTETVLSLFAETLPRFKRAPELEDGKVLCFRDEKHIVCVDQSSKGQLWLWWVEGTPTKQSLFAPVPSADHQSATLGPFGTGDEVSVRRWLEHYDRNRSLIDFSDPFRSRFRDAYVPLEAEWETARRYLREVIAQQVLELAETHSRVELAIGTIGIQDLPTASFGNLVVPARFQPVFERGRGSLNWAVEDLGPDFYGGVCLSRNQWAHTTRDLEKEMLDEYAQSQLAFSSGAMWIQLKDDRANCSVEFARKCNAGRTEVTRFLETISEDDWQAAQHAEGGDPLALLLEKWKDDPQDMQTCRRAAALLEERGETARANLILGLAYLKAGRRGIARGKLTLAEQSDPHLEGLKEAWEEWNRE